MAQTKAPRLGYVGGWLGHRNLGDEALLAAYRHLFPGYGFVTYPYHISQAALQVSRWRRACVAGVLAGGTLIGRGDADTFGAVFEAFPSSFVFGTGVANPSFWSDRDPSFKSRLAQWRPLLERCRYVGVRGPLSAEILADLGIGNVEVVGDPVLAFAEDQGQATTATRSPALGLNIGQSKGQVWGGEQRLASQFVSLARIARARGWEVSWFVVWEEDWKTTVHAARASGTSQRIHRIYDNPQAFLNLVRPLTAFVGMKLHAVVLATCAYVPSIMVEYRPKCRDYMKSIGQEDVTIRGDVFDGAAAWEIVKSWESQRPERARSLYGGISALRRIQQRRAEQMSSALQAGGDFR
jgi:hypothetical protein